MTSLIRALVTAWITNKFMPTGGVISEAAAVAIDAWLERELQLPEPSDWQQLEQQGWQRLAQVRNLELLPGLFRRPLEVWLLLDRALFMQEQGYRVQVGQFCEQQLTPRNLLLLAEKIHAQPTPML